MSDLLTFHFLSSLSDLLKFLVPILLALFVIKIMGVIRYVPNSRAAVIERVWSPKGSLESGVIALNGEAGLMPELLRGGLHFFSPFMYKLHYQAIPVVPNNELAYVFARGGQQLAPAQVLASNAQANNFEDARHFLEHGGQKGPQRLVLRGGLHPINLAQFAVLTKSKVYALNLDPDEEQMLNDAHEHLQGIGGFDPVVIDGEQDQIGIVMTLDGPPSNDIVQPVVGDDPNNAETFHHAFQDPDAFIRAGGRKGRQYQVLVGGSYYINRMFATVELFDKLAVPVGYVGVVVSNFGRDPEPETEQDIEGAEANRGTHSNKHGRLVGDGYKGVRRNVLPPGKYPFNWYAGQVMQIPTTNLILLWDAGKTSEHKLDANLKEVRLITKDAFEPDLPLSVVLHVDPRKAAAVVQRFGGLDQLVNQTVDPLVASYFKNVAQGKKAVELVHDRSQIQDESLAKLKEVFARYDVELVDVVLGTPFGQSIEPVLQQIRSAQIAEQEQMAYGKQEEAAKALRSLNEQQAAAAAQGDLTRSSINIQVIENDGIAQLKAAEQEAKKIRALAEANSDAAKLEGAGQGAKLEAIGKGEAAAIAARFEAAGGKQNGLMLAVFSDLTHAVQEGKIPLVPHTLISGGGDGGESNALIQLWKVLSANAVDKSAAPALLGGPETPTGQQSA